MDAFIARHLKGVSRTYAIVIPILPRGLSEPVGLAYLLMRIVDTLEDAPQLDDAQRAAELRRLDKVLADGGDDEGATFPPMLGDLPAEQALMTECREVVRRVRALEPSYREPAVRCAQAMIAGVLNMLERGRERGVAYPAIRDSAELREYCYYVAGVVGEMLCAMMAHYLKAPPLLRLRDVAVELGIGLQLVNILKDALRDSHHGRRYLPLTAEGSVSHAEVYRAVLAEARRSLERGAEFVLALPRTAWELRSFCGLPIAWGAMTLARAERDASRAKIGRETIHATIERFTNLARDDQALRHWLTGLIRPAAGGKPT